MKRIISAMLLILMLFASTAALGETATYPTTKAFIAKLDELNAEYTIYGIDADGDERVELIFENDTCSFTIVLFFDQDLDRTLIRVWNLITYDPSNAPDIYKICSDLNFSYNFTRFYADSRDNTVTAAYDIIYRYNGYNGSDIAEIVFEGMAYCHNIINDAFPNLATFNLDR